MCWAFHSHRQAGAGVSAENEVALAARIGAKFTLCGTNRGIDALFLHWDNDRAGSRQAIIVICACLREDRAYRADRIVGKLPRRNHAAMLNWVEKIASRALQTGRSIPVPLAHTRCRIKGLVSRASRCLWVRICATCAHYGSGRIPALI